MSTPTSAESSSLKGFCANLLNVGSCPNAPIATNSRHALPHSWRAFERDSISQDDDLTRSRTTGGRQKLNVSNYCKSTCARLHPVSIHGKVDSRADNYFQVLIFATEVWSSHVESMNSTARVETRRKIFDQSKELLPQISASAVRLCSRVSRATGPPHSMD